MNVHDILSVFVSQCVGICVGICTCTYICAYTHIVCTSMHIFRPLFVSKLIIISEFASKLTAVSECSD